MIYGYDLLQAKSPTVCIFENAQQCEKAHRELAFFAKGLSKSILHLPSYELHEEDRISPSAHIVATRLQTLAKLATGQFDILLTTYDTITYRLPPQDFVKQNIFEFHEKQKLDPTSIIKDLLRCGFQKVSQVNDAHTFAQRGEILDIYLPQLTYPIRIVFDDDIIESMMKIDLATQRSTSRIQHISIVPTHEYDPAQIKQYTSDPHLIKQIKDGKTISAWQHHLHQLHTNLATLLDYLPQHAKVMSFMNLNSLNEHQHHITKRLQKLDLNHSQLLISKVDIEKLSHRCSSLTSSPKPKLLDFSIKDKQFGQKLEYLTKSHSVLLICQNHFRYTELENLLLEHDIQFNPVKSWTEFASKDIKIGICMGELHQSVQLKQLNQYLIPEHILSEQTLSPVKHQNPTYQSYSTLKIGDLLVHEDHGVGRFTGMEVRTVHGVTQDFVAITYANDDKLLFLPNMLYKIHPYHGTEQQLDQLKSERWKKRKAKAIKNIEQFSASLLQHSATRQQSHIQAMPLPSEYSDFKSSFPFVDTTDQHHIMEHIISDLGKTELFDRLICGDVGFGKTELALRSAFIVAMNAFQVVLIAPTTVLANQHYQTFQERFKDWPINIELLTRATKQVGGNIKSGKTDIIIGTHKVLNLTYHKLGLVIIDEEHRFGVKQKDSIRAFSKAHRLSLTATPIPRSLNMALSKLRKISMMSVAPNKRLPIITHIGEEDQEMMKTAIDREIRRGGQVYVLVNEIKKIPSARAELQKLCPHVSFGTLHGQMTTDAIERQMAKFYAQDFQVLIASTIIEAGIDIANANTLIVFRADKLGLAQMHQLRGRIGRSHHQGFAYFLTPRDAKITQDAQMRLDAIAQHTALGSGIKLALADLEIRGAGSLLGEEQSGHVNAIGISMYTSLLNKALPSTDIPTTFCEMKAHMTLMIPESYIAESTLRYQFYHEIANATTEPQLIDVADTLTDRFGSIPTETMTLIQVERLKMQASKLNMKRIEIHGKHCILTFGEEAKIKHDILMKAIQENPAISLTGPHSIKLEYNHTFFTSIQSLLLLIQQ